MSKEALSGPRQVALAAGLLQECPHIAGSPEAVKHISGPQNFQAEGLLRFAGLKVVTDELADRLPGMQAKFPPYGLPEPDGSSQIEGGDTPLKAAMSWLNPRYKAKLSAHIDDELEKMTEDPRFKPIIESINAINVRINSGAGNNVETMTGLLSIMPAVLGSDMTHEDIIAIARNSQRLPVIPSLLGRSDLDAFRIAGTEDEEKSQPWGFAFKPDLFTEQTDQRTGKRYVDYAGGIGSLDLTAHWEHVDEMTEQYFSSIPPAMQRGRVPEEYKAYRPKTLEGLTEGYSPRTCPARQLILATWKDMLDIADQERMFDLESEPTASAQTTHPQPA